MSEKKKAHKHAEHKKGSEKTKESDTKVWGFIALIALVLIIILVIIIVRNNTGTQTQEQNIAALVNGNPVYVDEVNEVFAVLGQQIPSITREVALNQTIYLKVLELEAENLDIQVDQATVDNIYNDQLNIALSQMTREEFDQYLASQLLTQEQFEQDAKNAIYRDQLIFTLLQQEVYNKLPEISDEQALEIFNTEVVPFAEQVTASHILICYQGASRCTADYTQEEAEALIADIKLNITADNFAEYAQEYSTGPSGPSGGSLGTFGKGQMVPPFEQAAFSLDIDQVSDVVETDFGYHLILVSDKSDIPDFEELKQTIKDQVKISSGQEAEAAYIESLRANAEIEIVG